MATQGNNSTKSRNFLSYAKSAFAFLGEFGFVVYEEGVNFLKLRGQQGFIEICYDDSYTYELDVNIGFESGSAVKWYSLGLLIGLSDSAEGENYRVPMVSTEQALQECLNVQAGCLLKYRAEFFAKNGDLAQKIDDFWQKMAQKRAFEALLAEKRTLAGQAFREKKFEDVVQYLSEIEEWVTKSERMKLAYARKHLHM